MSLFNYNHNNVIICKNKEQQAKIVGLSNLVSHDPLVNVRWVDKKNAQNPSKDSDVKVFSAERVIFDLRARYYVQQAFDALAVSTIVLGVLSMLVPRIRGYYAEAFDVLSEAFNFDQSAENYLEVLQQRKAYRGILIGFLPLYLVGYVVSHVFTALWKGLKALSTIKRFFGQLYKDFKKLFALEDVANKSLYDYFKSAVVNILWCLVAIPAAIVQLCLVAFNYFKKLYAPEDVANKSLYDYLNSAVVHILWYLVAIPASIVQSCLVAFVANDLAAFIDHMKNITEVYKGQYGYIPQEYISHDDDKPKFTMAPMILLVLPIYYVLQPVKWIMRGLGWICHINIDVGTQISFLVDKINVAQGTLYGCLEAPFSYWAARNLKRNIVLHDKVSEADEVFIKRYTNLFKRPIGKQFIFTGISDQDRGCLRVLTPSNELVLLESLERVINWLFNWGRNANDLKKSDELEPMPVSVASNLFSGNNRASDDYDTLNNSDEYNRMI